MMYSFNDLLNNCCKTEQDWETTDMNQSHVMISQRGMPENPESSFDAIDHQDIPYLVASSSQANGSKTLQRSYVRESLSQAFDEELIDTRIGNDQQLSRNIINHKATTPVNTEMSYRRHPFPACQLSANGRPISPYQLDTPSGSSKKMPLYQISSKNGGALSHKTSSNQTTSPLYSLSSLVETTVGLEVESAKTNTQAVYQPRYTYGGTLKGTVANGQSCPSNCPCVCHVSSQSVPSPSPVFKEERRSVIMAPVGRNYRTSRVTHTPLQIEDNVNKPQSIILGQEIASRVGEVSDDSDEEEPLFHVDIDGQRAKFKLTENDWKVMQVNQFPSGGRLLAGDWTNIFKRGVRESNPWCSLRFKNNHVRSENSRKINSAPFFRGAAECKKRECNVRMKFIIKEEKGKYVIVTYTGNVCHRM